MAIFNIKITSLVIRWLFSIKYDELKMEKMNGPVVITEEAHLAACASIPMAPNHSKSRAQEEL